MPIRFPRVVLKEFALTVGADGGDSRAGAVVFESREPADRILDLLESPNIVVPHPGGASCRARYRDGLALVIKLDGALATDCVN